MRRFHTDTSPLEPPTARRCGASAQKLHEKMDPTFMSSLANRVGALPDTSHSFTFLSVDAVASRPAAAWQKLRVQVGLSCADRRNNGADPAPVRASKQATMPSSEDTRKLVGWCGCQAVASTSALTCEIENSCDCDVL